MINKTQLDIALKAAGIPIDGVGMTDGKIRIDFKAEATPEQQAAAAAILAAFPDTAPTYQGLEVWDANGVDAITLGSILELMRPGAGQDLQAGAEMRQLKDVAAALIALLDGVITLTGVSLTTDLVSLRTELHNALDLDKQVEVIRQAGADFKAQQGWK